MRKYWQAVEGYFNGLKPREQLLVALLCAALAYTVLDTLLVSSTVAGEKRVRQELTQKRQEIESLSVQLRALRSRQQQDPDAAARIRLEQLGAQLARVQEEIKEQSAMVVPADRMAALLERLLAGHPRLELVELKTLPRTVLDVGAAAKTPSKPTSEGRPSNQAGQAGSEAAGAIYRYGLELSIKGGYLDLLGYVRDVESLPQRVYWDRMELAVTEFPSATLKLVLYTISFDGAWMKV